jgi:hypothetical protein
MFPPRGHVGNWPHHLVRKHSLISQVVPSLAHGAIDSLLLRTFLPPKLDPPHIRRANAMIGGRGIILSSSSSPQGLPSKLSSTTASIRWAALALVVPFHPPRDPRH